VYFSRDLSPAAAGVSSYDCPITSFSHMLTNDAGHSAGRPGIEAPEFDVLCELAARS